MFSWINKKIINVNTLTKIQGVWQYIAAILRQYCCNSGSIAAMFLQNSTETAWEMVYYLTSKVLFKSLAVNILSKTREEV